MPLETIIENFKMNGARVDETPEEYTVYTKIQNVEVTIHFPKELNNTIDVGTVYGITPQIATGYFIIELKKKQPDGEKVELWYNYDGGFNVYMHGKINEKEKFEAVIRDLLSTVDLKITSRPQHPLP